jgi:hypothetical protein
LRQRLELKCAEYAGIVDQHIDRPERRFGGGHEFPQRLVVGHVGPNVDGLAPEPGDVPRGFRTIRNVRHDDLGAFGRKRNSERRADALRRSGHHRHFSAETRHFPLRDGV